MQQRLTVTLLAIAAVSVWTMGLPAYADRLFWSRNVEDAVSGLTGFLASSSSDGSNYVESYQVAGAVIGTLDVDPVAGRVYWVESDTLPPASTVTIMQGRGSTCERLPLDGVTAELALDVSGRKIYWVENGPGVGNGKIKRANLDFSSIEVLLSGLDGPNGIGLDSPGGKLYWYDFPTIKRSNLDGSDVETQFSAEWLVRFQIDPVEQKIYWINSFGGGLQRADFDGSNFELLAPQVLSAFVVDAGFGKVYFRDQHPPFKLRRADLDGSNEEVLLEGPIAGAYYLALARTDDAIPLGCGVDVPALGLRGAGALVLLLIVIGTWRAMRS